MVEKRTMGEPATCSGDMDEACDQPVCTGKRGIPQQLWLHILDECENVPKDTFMSRGHNLNDCYVVPSLDLVVVRQGNENPSSEKRLLFTKTLIQKIVAAMSH